MDDHHYHRSLLTLSQKQYAKITGTIASVRKRRELDTGSAYAPDECGEDGKDAEKDDDDPLNDSSFMAEDSFIRAPLNPRIPDNVKPQRNMHFSKSRRDKYASSDLSLSYEPLDTLHVEIQEALILEELLNVLMGIPGVYITCDWTFTDEIESPKNVKFIVSQFLEPSLRDLVERVLPLATSYTIIKDFIQQRSNLENGLVNHALCASIRTMLKDYHALIIQLENAFHTDPYFSLQKLWFYVHPTLHTLSLLQTLTRALKRRTSASISSILDSDDNSDQDSDSSSTRARNAQLGLAPNLKKIANMPLGSDLSSNSSPRTPPKGGEVLALLTTLLNTNAGDPRACIVFGTLLKDASRPYVRILLNWVKLGHLEDPYEEFMVRESRTIDKGILERDYVDEYWERRYTLRDGSTSSAVSDPGITTILHAAATVTKKPTVLHDGACIPPLLEPWKHKILLAGKYLNVIRECGMSVGQEDALPSLVSLETQDRNDIAMDDEKFFQIISNSYTHANKTLLHHLLHTHQLLPRLRTLHHFFFLSHSFYLTHFFDIAVNELRKPVKSVNTLKLSTLLSVAVNADDASGTGATSNPDVSSPSSLEIGRDDIKLIMQGTSLVEWLIKISSVKGAPLVGEPDEWLDKQKERGAEKEKNGKDKSKSNLTAIDLLSLDCTPPFPLSLVISRKAILRYQLIFRFLLSLKYLEYQLSNMWVEQKGTIWRTTLPPSLLSQPVSETAGTMGGLTPLPVSVRASTPIVGHTTTRSSTPITPPANSVLLSAAQSLTQWRTSLLILRGQMLAVVRHLLAFVLYSVLEVHWRTLEKKLSIAEKGSRSEEKGKEKISDAEDVEGDEHVNPGLSRDRIETVDQLLRDHVDFLDTCLKECMLSSSRLVKQHHRLLQTCTAFTWYTSTFTKSLGQGVAALGTLQSQALDSVSETSSSTPNPLKPDDIDKAMKTRWEFLERFKSNFEHWLQSYIEFVSFQASSENAALMPLVGRLKSVMSPPDLATSDFVAGTRRERTESMKVV